MEALAFRDDMAGTSAAAANSLQLIAFSIGEQTYGVEITTVREIRAWNGATPLPNTREFVRGVINLRGQVVPVIDLQSRLGRTSATVGKKTCIIIFDASRDGEKLELGLMVDSVSEVKEIPASHIEPPPQFGASIRRDFIRGMGKVDGEFIVILEPERALDVEDMASSAGQNRQA